MAIQIIADSTCDISPELMAGLDLKTLPLVITIGGESYLDGETIRVGEIYDIMRRGIVPKTSQIPYDRTYSLFKSCLENGSDVIYISFSSAMSSCFSLAKMVADELQPDFPERKLAVIDSMGGSGATGIIVLQALKMAASGAPFEEITAEVEFMAEHIEHEFSIDDLEWLAKGGRISKIVGTIGSKLGIHPILEIKKGSITVKKMIRGRKKTVQEVADKIIGKAAAFPAQLVAITHADDILSAKALEALIKKGLPNCLTSICHIGCVLGVHLGLKGIGAYCLNKKPKNYCLM